MTFNLAARFTCALTAIVRTGLAVAVMYYVFPVIPGPASMQWSVTARTALLVVLGFGAFGLLITACIGLMKLVGAMEEASYKLNLGLLATVTGWLLLVGILAWIARDIDGFGTSITATLLLFGVPAVITLVLWATFDRRTTPNAIHRVIGTLLTSPLPIACSIIGSKLQNVYGDDAFIYGGVIGVILIPTVLAFAFRCPSEGENLKPEIAT